MKNYLKSYQLLNFQSWDHTTKPINLESDVVNIIEGDNETGKSVLYKVFYNFAFPGYYTASELLRRGCTRGVMLLFMASGSIILYQLEEKHHAYVLTDSEGKETVWQDVPCPKEIIDELGLILDYDSKIILNIIDKDVTLPFVKTSAKLNGSLIRTINEPPDITAFFEDLAELTTKVEQARMHFSSKTCEAKAAADVLQYTDVDTLKQNKERIDILTDIVLKYNDLDKSMLELANVFTREPQPKTDPHYCESYLVVYEQLLSCKTVIQQLKSIKESQLVAIEDPSYLSHLFDVIDKCSICASNLKSLKLLLNTAPTAISKPDCENILIAMEYLSSVSDSIRQTAQTLSEFNIKNKEYAKVGEEVMKLRDEIGICPTCGRLLECNH